MIENEIKNTFEKIVSFRATPGINYAVIKDEKEYIGSLGLKAQYILDKDTLKDAPEENNIDTLYDIASLTKVVCTLPIIFRLQKKGKLNINDNVKKYLPDFKYKNITIYDLMTHRSGLPANFELKKLVSKEEIIKRLYEFELVNKKGTYLYTDIGYMLLGLIIEKVCNKSLDEVFDQEVRKPLEMKNTVFNPKQKEITAPTEVTITRGVVRGVVHDEKAYCMNGISGHAGLFSSIKDLVNFATMILNKGRFNGKRYLDKSVIETWFSKQAIKEGYKRSFCWFIGNNPNIVEGIGDEVISFQGFTGSSILIDIKNRLIIIMLANRIHPTRDNKLYTKLRLQISKKVYDIFEISNNSLISN
ncbi:MAG: serine hydrolase [Clostridium sp.]|nr:serine hydrolase [Clostridium sp.]MCM1444353.1 serine hydrolase [Candidatus Amulumruptor caecigallinarius]